MTLDEAQEAARLVVENKTRSHVGAARKLAEFVLSLRSVDLKRTITDVEVRRIAAVLKAALPSADACGVNVDYDLPDTEPPGSHDGDEPG